jgi:hypothetical protein
MLGGTPSPTIRFAGEGVQLQYALSREAGEDWGGGAAPLTSSNL